LFVFDFLDILLDFLDILLDFLDILFLFSFNFLDFLYPPICTLCIRVFILSLIIFLIRLCSNGLVDTVFSCLGDARVTDGLIDVGILAEGVENSKRRLAALGGIGVELLGFSGGVELLGFSGGVELLGSGVELLDGGVKLLGSSVKLLDGSVGDIGDTVFVFSCVGFVHPLDLKISYTSDFSIAKQIFFSLVLEVDNTS
jgi:hypothetical protein